jgi:hypothetical protein
LPAGFSQAPGALSLYGGAITQISSYQLSGAYTGDSSTRITITFTATSSTGVLAWGGHVASPANSPVGWGTGSSAASISGSPYHMRLIDLDGGGGNQDRGIDASAIVR